MNDFFREVLLMRRLKFVLLLISIAAVAGCSTQVTRPKAASMLQPEVKALHGFTVEMSPEAKEQLADNIKFDRDEFSAMLERTLSARDLVADNGDFYLKVVVKDIRVRSTFNAMMWGFMAGDDHLKGDAIIMDREDDPVYTFGVDASYALGGIAGGQDSARINWLYEQFAEKVADELVSLRDQD